MYIHTYVLPPIAHNSHCTSDVIWRHNNNFKRRKYRIREVVICMKMMILLREYLANIRSQCHPHCHSHLTSRRGKDPETWYIVWSMPRCLLVGSIKLGKMWSQLFGETIIITWVEWVTQQFNGMKLWPGNSPCREKYPNSGHDFDSADIKVTRWSTSRYQKICNFEISRTTPLIFLPTIFFC